MGRGGGGSGAGAGGGGRAARDAGTANAGTGNQIYSESPEQMELAKQNLEAVVDADFDERVRIMEEQYADLPPVENANRTIVGDRIVVGEKGAPKIGNPTLDTQGAADLLRNRGVPNSVISDLQRNYGEEGLRGIGELLKTNPQAQYLGSGVEGLAMAWSPDKVIRIQYGVGSPPPSYYVGRAGAYPDWLKRYGGVAVEQKERVWNTAARVTSWFDGSKRDIGGAVRRIKRAALDQYVRKVTKGKIRDADAHTGNWGIDWKGRFRVIDPGAYVPPGADVTGGGW